MAKRKKSKKPAKAAIKPRHNLPEGFWQQVAAVVLSVLAALLVLAMFGAGGPVLLWLLGAGSTAIGWAVYLLPVVLVYLAIEIFKAEGNRLPPVMKAATLLFFVWLAGFLQLFLPNPSDAAAARAGEGGGLVGLTVASGFLAMLDTRTSGLLLALLGLITALFVLRLSPRSLIDFLRNLFGREDDKSLQNSEVAARAASDAAAKSMAIGELKLNEGVPTVRTEGGKRLSSFRNSLDPKHEDDQTALTAPRDPDWQPPGLELLEKKQSPADAGDVKHNAQIIRDTLSEFGIDVEMEGANIGPKVTQYTLRPPSGVKLTRITALETNIALNLAAQSLRIEAPIPGQRAVGIEVPNRKAADVRLYGILTSSNWQSIAASGPLPFAIGRDIAGNAVVGELDSMPHVLIAGQTGSGKSVMINTMLTSLLYRNSPNEMKLILVDPKQVEMNQYSDIPHLLAPVIVEPEKCISAMKWAIGEMERRYSLLADQRVRNIQGYNQQNQDAAMPYIVIVIDELADLMMLAARDVEALVVRLAQKARAVGIHLVLATQRPSVDVITGLIKANIPARIAFTTTSQVDSRTILDQGGAEKLLGQGDMLLLTPQMSKPKRIQGAFVSEEEVIKITDHLRMQRPPEYDDEITAQPVQLNGRGGIVMDFDGGGDDDLYRDAVRVVVESGKASATLLQRRLRVGYARAARLIETMEEQGIVGPADGARPRDVLVSSTDEVFNGS
ncbi:MAG: DNA translocase FtsK [Candidatus Chaera renei]|uniref:DNA translocase FtsK n=1 Tax=Candidatus Chaera renei TaxID=2506947 RepID=A0A4Q0AIX9_9BACT|nr:MAG: DNA translocase FtsK [Candidatus Chaera renei]